MITVGFLTRSSVVTSGLVIEQAESSVQQLTVLFLFTSLPCVTSSCAHVLNRDPAILIKGCFPLFYLMLGFQIESDLTFSLFNT